MAWFPMTRQRWRERKSFWYSNELEAIAPDYLRDDDGVLAIEGNVGWLLGRLYKPVKAGAVLDEQACLAAGVDVKREAINWGDLGVSAVEWCNGGLVVTLQEAMPCQCPTLCEYVRSWLERWGWTPVEVRTEW